MKFLFIIVFFIYSISNLSARSLNGGNCGIKGPDRFDKIVGGSETGIHEFPWNVVGYFGRAGCGGTIIDKQWVVTAAHCVKQDAAGNVISPSQISLRFAAHNFNYGDPSVRDQWTFSVPVVQVFANENFNYQTLNHDIALLKLAQPLPLDNPSSYVSAICLPEPESNIDELAGQTATAIGYGSIFEPNGETPSVLLKTNLTIIRQSVCQQENAYLTNDVICAGADGHDVCTGDSGSELTTLNPKTNRWQLSGIASYVIGKCQGRSSLPSAFTRVSHMLPWIHNIMSSN